MNKTDNFIIGQEVLTIFGYLAKVIYVGPGIYQGKKHCFNVKDDQVIIERKCDRMEFLFYTCNLFDV